MKTLLPILAVCLLTLSINAQTISNQVNIGTTANDALTLNPIPNSSDYILFGRSDENISGNKTENSKGLMDYWVLKLDENFNILWDKTIGGDAYDYLFPSFVDENYVYLVGNSQSQISVDKTMPLFGFQNIWVVKMDLNGNIVDQFQYGGSDYESAPAIQEYTDSTLLISCMSGSGISGNKGVGVVGGYDVWLFEISKTTGNILQEKGIGSMYDDILSQPHVNPYNNHIYLTIEGQTGVSGDKTDPGFGSQSKDIWLVELDENWNIVQNKCFGGEDIETDGSLYFTENEIFLSVKSSSGISGNKTVDNHGPIPGASAMPDYWLLKLNYDLSIVWDYTYGGYSDERGHVNYIDGDGKLLVTIVSSSQSGEGNRTVPQRGGGDVWMLILNNEGQIIQQESFGGIYFSYPIEIVTNPTSGEFIFVAASNSPVSGNKTVGTWGGTDAWLAKLDASAFLNTETLLGTTSNVSVYPNPYIDIANFKFQNLKESVEICFYSITGKLLDKVSVPQGTALYEWNSASVDEPFILYEIKGETANHKGKLVRK